MPTAPNPMALEAALVQTITAVNLLIKALGGVPGAPAPAAPLATAPAGVSTPAPASAVAPPAAAASTALREPARTARGTSKARVASFNVLGASHTDPGGNKKGWKTGAARVPGMIQQLRGNGVEIAGLQEFQPSQQKRFQAADTGYELHAEKDNVIAWRKDRYEKVGSKSIAIPYFGGSPRRMPAVQLQDRQTGERVWVVNVHNPADVKRSPNNAANRAEAARRERALVESLEKSGVPVLIVGDFNDRTKSLDTLTQGGLTTVARPEQNAQGIDWVLGTRGVSFSDTKRDMSPRNEGTSDHPIVVTTAQF